MTAPIAVRVTRYACVFCSRTHSSRVRAVEHMDRCWNNPEVHGCKTCAHFEQDPGEPDVGLMGGEFCEVGVSLDGDGDVVKPGPIVHCPLWEAKTDA